MNIPEAWKGPCDLSHRDNLCAVQSRGWENGATELPWTIGQVIGLSMPQFSHLYKKSNNTNLTG